MTPFRKKIHPFRKKKGRVRRTVDWWDRHTRWIPPADHRVWPVIRLGLLVAFLYLNATNFDMSEGRTIIAVAVAEIVGIRRRA